jgi:electron transfer flavoprotein alpha subunit
VSRLRIERHPLPAPGANGRLRRDPRAERLGKLAAQSAEAAVGPSGRIRRDPRATRSPARAAAASAPPAPAALPRRPARATPSYLILAVPDLPEGRLDAHDRDVLGAARLLADAGEGNVVVLAPAATSDLGAAGADCVLPAPIPAGYAPEARAASVLAAIARLAPRHILFPERPTGGGDIGRRVAALLGEIPAVRVLRLSAEEVAGRGNGGASDFLRRPPRVILLAAEGAEPVTGACWDAEALSPIDGQSPATRLVDEGLAAADPNAVPLAEADFIVSAGNGVSDWQAFHQVAAALGAAEGGSRIVCDAGLLPRERQVGASGSLVEPRCYLAFGIAGATQHLQGITRCERVLAVNTDLHAEMVKRADLAIIADAQQVMPALARLARDRLRGRHGS